MVSAPSGRVCKKKKKKCTSRSYNDGNSDCHSLHSSAFIENTSSITLSLSLSLFLADARDLVAFRLLSVTRSRTSFYRVHHLFPPLFISFFQTTLLPGSHSGAECDSRRSLVNVRGTMKKSCMYDVVSSTESNFHLYDEYIWQRPHVCAWSFLVTKELMTKHRNCVVYTYIDEHFQFNLWSHTQMYTYIYPRTIYPGWVSDRITTYHIFKCI